MKPRYKRRKDRLGRYPMMTLLVAIAVAAFLVPLVCITLYLVYTFNLAAKTFTEGDSRITIDQRNPQ